MKRTGEAQEIFNAIDALRDKIRLRRATLAMTSEIPAEWPLTDRNVALNYVSKAATKAGLTKSEIKLVVDDFNKRLDSNPVITVSILEDQLLNLQSEVNDALLISIVASISDPKIKIQNASNELKLAIDKLNNLNEIFSTITIAVNLIAGFVSASAGNFNPLLSIIPELIP